MISWYMGVSKNRGTPKSSILIGFSLINHPFWGTPIFGNPHILWSLYLCIGPRMTWSQHFLDEPIKITIEVWPLGVKSWKQCHRVCHWNQFVCPKLAKHLHWILPCSKFACLKWSIRVFHLLYRNKSIGIHTYIYIYVRKSIMYHIY